MGLGCRIFGTSWDCGVSGWARVVLHAAGRLRINKEPRILILAIHKGEAIGKAVEACLEYWGIDDKLFTVTVDNSSSNDVACAHLNRMVRRTGCVNDGKNLHVRCIAHTINLIVWDGIRQHGVCIDRVRNALKYVKSSPSRILGFKDLVQKRT
uniref:Uncharacterized protein n=1 Tax=Chenopodium quinoa TaxID=63459 RepID=A0A803NCN4_CHEQI